VPLACHYRLFSGSPGAAKPPNEPQDGLPPRAGPGRTRVLAGIYLSGVSWICNPVVPKKPLALVCPTATGIRESKVAK